MMRKRSVLSPALARRERHAAAMLKAKRRDRQHRALSSPYVQPPIPMTWHLSMPAGQGPPTELAVKSRTRLHMLVVLQGIVCGFRISIFPLLDVVGFACAVLVAVITSLGLYAV